MPVDISVKITGLSAADLDRIVKLPQTVASVVTTAKATIDAVRGGGNAANPASAFFHTLSTLGGDVAALPGVGAIVAPVEALVSELPAGFGNPAAIASSVREALRFFGVLEHAVASGSIAPLIDQVVGEVLGGAGNPSTALESAGPFAEARTFFELFASIAGWRNAPPDPRSAAAVLSIALFGVSHDLLAAPAAALEAALAPLERLTVRGPEVDAWRGAPAALRATWTHIGQLAAAPSIDWHALRAALDAAHAQAYALAAARDRAYALTLATVGSVSIGSFDAVAASASTVAPKPPDPVGSVYDHLLGMLRGFVTAIDTVDLQPDAARAMVRDLVRRYAGKLANSPLGGVRVSLVNGQQRLMDLLDDLPFVALARDVHDALRKLGEKLDVLDPQTVAKPLHAFFGTIEHKLDGLPHDQIKAAVAGVWSTVGDAMHAVQTEVAAVVALLQHASTAIASFTTSAQPALHEVTAAVEAIKAEIESFDLDVAAQTVIGDIHKLKATVAAIDVSKLPSPAVGLLKAGAEAVRKIDVAGMVNPPLARELDKIDPTPALEEALRALGGVTKAMRQIDPAALATKLDAPVDELLHELAKLGPDGLKALIEKALQPVKDAVHQLDAAVLLEPLIALYRTLMAKVDTLLDPDPLFAPLERMYQPVLDVIDAIEPGRLLGLLGPHGGAIANVAKGASAVPASAAKGTAALKAALDGGAVAAQDALHGFRPGDLLDPLIEIHHAIASVVNGVGDEILAAAGGHLADALVGRLRALRPVEIRAQVGAAIAPLAADFEPLAFLAAADDAIAAYERACGAIGAAASLHLPAVDLALAADIQVTLPGLDPRALAPAQAQRTALVTATAALRARIDPSVLGPVVAKLERALGPALAPLMKLAGSGATEVRGLLAALDPTPVRDEINAVFDELGLKLAALSGTLEAILDEIGKAIEEFILPLSPGNLIRLAQALHADVRAQAAAVGPAAYKPDVRRIFAIVRAQLAILDPQQLVTEINGLRDHLLGVLDALVADLMPDRKPFDDLMAELALLKPSALLAPVTASLQPLTDLIAALAPDTLLKPIIDAVAHVKAEIPTVVAEIVAALDDVLSAFPDGGTSGGSVTVGVSVSG